MLCQETGHGCRSQQVCKALQLKPGNGFSGWPQEVPGCVLQLVGASYMKRLKGFAQQCKVNDKQYIIVKQIDNKYHDIRVSYR